MDWRLNHQEVDLRDPGQMVSDGVRLWTFALSTMVLLSCVFFGLAEPGDLRHRTAVGVTALAVAAAAAAVGAFTGFLFGLPRARFVDIGTGAEKEPSARPSTHFLVSTNLVRVADWVTTIIVGLTLIQLGHIPPAVSSFVDELEGPLGGSAHAGTFGVGLTIVTATAGMIVTYLWTGIRVRRLLEQSEGQDVAVLKAIDHLFDEDARKYVEGPTDEVLGHLVALASSTSTAERQSIVQWCDEEMKAAQPPEHDRLQKIKELVTAR